MQRSGRVHCLFLHLTGKALYILPGGNVCIVGKEIPGDDVQLLIGQRLASSADGVQLIHQLGQGE